MDYLSNNVAVNLKRIRKSKSMSLDQVSEQTGVSKSMLAQIERDIHCPNRVDKCFLRLHYTFIERKLSTGFWIIAVKFMFLNEFWLRY